MVKQTTNIFIQIHYLLVIGRKMSTEDEIIIDVKTREEFYDIIR